MNQYLAVIQAGGKGTRMVELTHDEIPKPLLALNGKPMIEWQIINLKAYGITEFVIITGHLGHLIEEYFGDGSKWGVKIFFVHENEPLGSAGALFYIKKFAENRDVIFVFGDVMFDLDWKRFITFHEDKGGMITLLAHPNSHPFDSDILIVDKEECVRGIDSKLNVRDYSYNNCVNAGISIFKHNLLDEIKDAKKIDFEKQIVSCYLKSGQVYAYRTPEYVKDVGLPERFRISVQEQENGVWEAKCLKNTQKAVFLDRDGTINVLKGFLKKSEDFELIDGVAEAIKKLNVSQYLTIVATNQPVVARGECTYEELDNIHRRMETELGKSGAYVDDLFYCPHHPDKGYEGEVSELKIKCECRKPNIGMLKAAAEKYNIDLSKSWYVGDTTMDIQTGINAGMKTVLVKTGEAGRDGKYDVNPTATVNTLKDAVDYILNVK